MVNKGGYKRVIRLLIVAMTIFLMLPMNTAFGAESDPQEGTASQEIENMIALAKGLIGKTPYVYGGGHGDWSQQKDKEIPDGLDCSSFVAWAMYNGMGIGMGGIAPVSGDFKNYLTVIGNNSMDGAQRGDIIADGGHVEIYLGEDENGRPMSLHAANEREDITITETNWGAGMDGKVLLRIDIDEAKDGLRGLTYDASLIKDEWKGKTGATSNTTTGTVSNTGTSEDLYKWLDPIVDFTGSSNTHSKSDISGKKRIDGNTKGLKGHQGGIFSGLFGGF